MTNDQEFSLSMTSLGEFLWRPRTLACLPIARRQCRSCTSPPWALKVSRLALRS
ncbi:hypothetical protein IEO21_03113 [Rhodonia placenta]|uniref:Uncharacterized protein n=1 Tax=Rhodonia placenta TaxID=104341 RepID=A0A8H7P6A4_9APHY|nr:hypothetical protein IEO21_03113 [Postia placenta]